LFNFYGTKSTIDKKELYNFQPIVKLTIINLCTSKTKIKMTFKISFKEVLRSGLIAFYTTFVVSLILGNLFSAIITILPAEIVGFGSTKMNILGYVAHCSFAPWSTIISLVFVGLGIFLLIRLIKYLKLKNITFLKLMSMYAVAIVVPTVVITCFPLVLICIGAYLLYKLIKNNELKSQKLPYSNLESKN
jgi:hypothetical protein